MSMIYRSSIDAPPFGRRTLWTPDPERAEALAQFEAAATRAPLTAERTLWMRTQLDTAECTVTLDAETRNVLQQSQTETVPEGVLALVEERGAGYRWARIVAADWPGLAGVHLAALYLGSEPLEATRAG